MPTTTQPPKPKRRWYQFSLRTLLVVMAVSCVAFAWIGVRMHRARGNREESAVRRRLCHDAVAEVVAEIEKLSGVVTVWQVELRPQTWLEMRFDDPGDPDDPVGVWKVTFVNFDRTKVADADLDGLKGLTDLEALDLGGTQVTDVGLEHLIELTHLQHLNLTGTNVTNAGVKKLQQALLPKCLIQH